MQATNPPNAVPDADEDKVDVEIKANCKSKSRSSNHFGVSAPTPREYFIVKRKKEARFQVITAILVVIGVWLLMLCTVLIIFDTTKDL
jgi:hypothetical protein